MGKNILVFSDGTGLRGGIFFGEKRSNVYKLYRATYSGPNSRINPAEQLVFYDPGVGSIPRGWASAFGRWCYNFIGLATGMGLTANIIDCYAAIIRRWEPGDRIFLFGFSRGAYTVRCLASVLSLCGIPTRMKNDAELKCDDPTSIRRIAREAIRTVYQHTRSWNPDTATPRHKELLAERELLAQNFRATYHSDFIGESNAYPYFIGVLETVASFWRLDVILLIAAMLVCLILSFSFLLSLVALSFLRSVALSLTILIIMMIVGYLWTHIKLRPEIPSQSTRLPRVHLAEPLMKFYDTSLNRNVVFARHALAIDERRAAFDPVTWDDTKTLKCSIWKEIPWFKEVWFSGNHSDIGGDCIENESRLSDISLKWMLDEAIRVPNGIKVDKAVLKLDPTAAGMQHDQTGDFPFCFQGKKDRAIRPDACLHTSVYERCRLTAVLRNKTMAKYRPTSLSSHPEFQRVASEADSGNNKV